VSGVADRRAIQIQGQITGYTNDIPSEMVVEYSNESGSARYRLLYDYAIYSAPFYPSRIRVNLLRENREVEYQSYSIQSVSTADKPLPRSYFDPAPFIEANHLQLQYFTNENLYFALPSGKIIETFGSNPRVKFTRADYQLNRYYYIAVFATAACFIALWFRGTRSEKQTKTSPIQ
jgi:hypothetical protein